MTQWLVSQGTMAAHSLFIRVVLAGLELEATVSVRSAAASWKPKNRERSKFLISPLILTFLSIERDAQLLANRIALLK
jgi:hypothetical protein